MKHRRYAENERRGRVIEDQTSGVEGDALALREVYPPEEFAGFENFGEFPEWHPGQAGGEEVFEQISLIPVFKLDF